jgi:hypothetical protein
MVQHDGARIANAQPLEEVRLERLRFLEAVGGDRIDDRDAERLVVVQQRLGVEEHAAVAAPVRGRARAVDDDRVAPPPVTRVVGVVGVVDLLEREAPMLQFGDQPGRPVRMLVDDRNRRGNPGFHIAVTISDRYVGIYHAGQPACKADFGDSVAGGAQRFGLVELVGGEGFQACAVVDVA